MNTQNPNSEDNAPYYEEDEINLLDLFLVLLKHKKLIFFTVLIAAVLAVIYSLSLPNIYRSQASLSLRPEDQSSRGGLPGLGGIGDMVAGQFGLGGVAGLEKLKATLTSRKLTREVIEKYDIMPVLFEDKWDQVKKEWIDKENPPTIQDAYKQIVNNLLKININQDANTITVGFENKNPEFAKTMVEYYINELADILREEVLLDAGEKKKFFNQQLDTLMDPLLREKVASLLAKEIERETFAKAQRHYGFLLVDPPIVPDPDKKIKPKRSMICILSVFVALFFSIFLAFIVEFISRIKTEDPERYNAIAKEIKFWK